MHLRMNHPADVNCFQEIVSAVGRVIPQISPNANSFQNRPTAASVENEERRVEESGDRRRVVGCFHVLHPMTIQGDVLLQHLQMVSE